MRESVPSEVDRVDTHLPRVQQVGRLHRPAKELDHDDGEVTATMKVERKRIAGTRVDTIENVRGGGPAPTPEEQVA